MDTKSGQDSKLDDIIIVIQVFDYYGAGQRL